MPSAATRRTEHMFVRTSVRYASRSVAAHFPAHGGAARLRTRRPPTARRAPPAVARRPRHAARPRSRSSSSTSRPPAARPTTDAITEIGALEAARRRAARPVRDAREPGRADPADDHGAHRHHRGDGAARRRASPRCCPPLLEFVGDAVIVGHNIRFDCAFLDAALVAHGYPRLSNRRVDTLALARRLVRDEVPNLRLAHAGAPLPHQRRADATARTPTRPRPPRCCTRCSNGPRRSACSASTTCSRCRRSRAHPSAAKLALTAQLAAHARASTSSATAAAACSTSARRRTCAPGCARTSRADDRRKVPQLLRETVTRSTTACAADPLEAAVRELRLIQRLQPRFNRQGKAWRQLRLPEAHRRALPAAHGDAHSRAPTASLVSGRSARPRPRTRAGGDRDARCRCGAAPRASGGSAAIAAGPPCVPAQLGVAACPCRGQVAEDAYAEFVGTVQRALTSEPEVALRPLETRMHRLADDERFEEAAATRDRLAALARALAAPPDRRDVARHRATRRRVRRPARRDPARPRPLARRR